MKRILFLAAIAIIALTGVSTVGYAIATIPTNQTYEPQEEVEHGGGCRKSSPQGMCCHMDNSTGIVHCH